jgi:hypothetical protein
MSSDPNPTPATEFLFEVERLYTRLTQSMRPAADAAAEPSLGGELLYAAELAPSRALLVAANIAGAASLAATADAAAQRQAIRDGVIDFLVNSLDEALRILKNEIRKRQPVAVCISLASEAIEEEMQERGVLPDLFSAKIVPEPQPELLILCTVRQAPVLWLPKLDAIAMNCLEIDKPKNMGAPGPSHLGTWETRWVKLAPRYLGRLAHGLRLYPLSEAGAANFIAEVNQKAEIKEITTAIEIKMIRKDGVEQYTFRSL